MNYADEEIEEYTKILNYFKNNNKVIEEYTKMIKTLNNEVTYTKILNYFKNKVKCVNCQKKEFIKIKGYYWCTNCGYGLGHYIGDFDKRDYDRTIYRKKSIKENVIMKIK